MAQAVRFTEHFLKARAGDLGRDFLHRSFHSQDKVVSSKPPNGPFKWARGGQNEVTYGMLEVVADGEGGLVSGLQFQ